MPRSFVILLKYWPNQMAIDPAVSNRDDPLITWLWLLAIIMLTTPHLHYFSRTSKLIIKHIICSFFNSETKKSSHFDRSLIQRHHPSTSRILSASSNSTNHGCHVQFHYWLVINLHNQNETLSVSPESLGKSKTKSIIESGCVLVNWMGTISCTNTVSLNGACTRFFAADSLSSKASSVFFNNRTWKLKLRPLVASSSSSSMATNFQVTASSSIGN